MDSKQGLIVGGSVSLGVIGALLANLAIKKRRQKKNEELEEEIEFEQNALRAVHSRFKVTTRRDTDFGVHQQFVAENPRLKIPINVDFDNHLIEELRFLDHPLCEIEKVHNLITDNGLTHIDDIVSRKAMPQASFVFTNSFVLYKIEYGPTCLIQQAKKWLRAGPRYHLYFKPEEVKPLILSVGSIVPGINVVIREVVRTLQNNYGVKSVFGAKYGYKGVVEELFVELTPQVIDSIHTNGGSFLGVCRGGFNLNAIIKQFKHHGFNQIYIIGGDGALRSANALHAEIQKHKLNISICVIPKSVQGDIPITEEQMGFQTTLEETSKAVEAGFVESESHEFGISLIRCFGRNSGFIASQVSEATGCVDIVLVPEFRWELYGEKGVLEYIRQQIVIKNHLIIVVSEGAVNSIGDVELQNQGQDESGNEIFVNIGEFLKDKITQYCKQKKQPITIKFIDPLYITRACRANPYDTKICSQMAQNAVHGSMAGFTGFAIVIVHHKTAFVSLTEMISGKYETKLAPNNRSWQRVLSRTLQPSFINNEEEHLAFYHS